MRNHSDCFVTSASVGKAEHTEEETKEGKEREDKQQGLLPNQQESLPRRSVTFSPLFVPQRLLIILVFSCLFFS